jgi:hypothetical protein
MKKITLTPELQGILWFWFAVITLGVLMAVIMTFITEFFNAII